MKNKIFLIVAVCEFKCLRKGEDILLLNRPTGPSFMCGKARVIMNSCRDGVRTGAVVGLQLKPNLRPNFSLCLHTTELLSSTIIQFPFIFSVNVFIQH